MLSGISRQPVSEVVGDDDLTHNPQLTQGGKRFQTLLGSLRSREVVGVDDLTHNRQLSQGGRRF